MQRELITCSDDNEICSFMHRNCFILCRIDEVLKNKKNNDSNEALDTNCTFFSTPTYAHIIYVEFHLALRFFKYRTILTFAIKINSRRNDFFYEYQFRSYVCIRKLLCWIILTFSCYFVNGLYSSPLHYVLVWVELIPWTLNPVVCYFCRLH